MLPVLLDDLPVVATRPAWRPPLLQILDSFRPHETETVQDLRVSLLRAGTCWARKQSRKSPAPLDRHRFGDVGVSESCGYPDIGDLELIIAGSVGRGRLRLPAGVQRRWGRMGS